MQTVNTDILNLKIDELDERLEGFALATAASFQEIQNQFGQIIGQINSKFVQIDHRFGQIDRRFDELKEMGYSNGDAIARMIKKMDEEFSAATIRQMRLEERVERIEKAHEFI